MNRKTSNIRTSIIEVLFWLLIQAGILNYSLSLAITLDPNRLLYYGMWGNMNMYVFDVCFTVAVIVYTIVGVVINKSIPINSKKWWKAIGICYAAYIVLSVVGGALLGGQWFWDGTGIYLMSVVWIAPVLLLGEMEIVHWYLSNQRKKYLADATK